MGRRRRSQKKVQTKKRAVVSKTFKCPFCSMEDAVTCKIKRDEGKAILTCRVCQKTYETSRVNYLTEPIDVFCEWIDECEQVQDEEREEEEYD